MPNSSETAILEVITLDCDGDPGAHDYFPDRDYLRVKGFYSIIPGTANLFPMQDPIESGSHEIVAYGYAYRSAKHREYLRFPESMMQMPCGVLYPDKIL